VETVLSKVWALHRLWKYWLIRERCDCKPGCTTGDPSKAQCTKVWPSQQMREPGTNSSAIGCPPLAPVPLGNGSSDGPTLYYVCSGVEIGCTISTIIVAGLGITQWSHCRTMLPCTPAYARHRLPSDRSHSSTCTRQQCSSRGTQSTDSEQLQKGLGAWDGGIALLLPIRCGAREWS